MVRVITLFILSKSFDLTLTKISCMPYVPLTSMTSGTLAISFMMSFSVPLLQCRKTYAVGIQKLFNSYLL